MPSEYISLAAIAVTLFAVMIVRPWPAVAAILCFAPAIWAFGTSMNGNTYAVPINLAVAIAGAATMACVRFLLLPQQDRLLRLLRLSAIGYCIAVFPSATLHLSLISGLGVYTRLISPIVMLFTFLHCTNLQEERLLFRVFPWAGLCMLGIVFAARRFGEDQMFMGGSFRLRAFSLSPQHISMFSVGLAAPLILGMFQRSKIWNLLILAGLAAATVATGLRTAWVGGVVLLGSLAALAIRSIPVKTLAIVIIGVVIVAFGGAFLSSLRRYVPSNAPLSMANVDSIISGRLTVDAVVLKRYMAGDLTHLVFGLGLLGAKEPTQQELGFGFMVHSDLLATLTESGLAGVTGYITVWIVIGWALLDTFRSRQRGIASKQLAACAFGSYIAFAAMGIPGALYTNVFVSWICFSFWGVALSGRRRPGDRNPPGWSRPASRMECIRWKEAPSRSTLEELYGPSRSTA